MPYKDKEKYKEYQKAYQLKNKLKLSEYKKQYREDNKERLKEYFKGYGKDGYNYVYLLEDYNYVGCTNSISNRFRAHKSEHKRDCTNHRILYKTKDRSEALELEQLLHSMGYNGADKHSHYR